MRERDAPEQSGDAGRGGDREGSQEGARGAEAEEEWSRGGGSRGYARQWLHNKCELRLKFFLEISDLDKKVTMETNGG